MAVAVPVLERTTNENREERVLNYGGMTADELHNARISDNLARLLNPENKIKDVVASIDAHGTQVIQPAAPAQYESYAEQPAARPVMLVKNARADADLFRADSAINAPAAYRAEQPAMFAEEENEDLRPTSTTIQYQSIGAAAEEERYVTSTMSRREEQTEEQTSRKSRINLTKRDKIIIGIIVGLILSVFVLIIVNSAIISGLSSDIDMLEGRAQEANANYNEVMEDINELKSYDNLYNFAIENDLI